MYRLRIGYSSICVRVSVCNCFGKSQGRERELLKVIKCDTCPSWRILQILKLSIVEDFFFGVCVCAVSRAFNRTIALVQKATFIVLHY